MAETRCPFAAWRPITTNYAAGGRKRIRGFVPHVQVGNGSLFGFFNQPKPAGKRASTDFWCSKTGTLEQYVDLADESFAQGSKEHNGNPTFVSCEFEGFPHEPMNDVQINLGGRLIAWVVENVNSFLLQVNHDPDHGEGITPHYVFGGGHTCPGPGPREGQFPDLIAAAQRWLGHDIPGDDDLTPEQDELLRDIFDRVTGMHQGVTTDDGVYHGWTDKRGRGDLRTLDPALKPILDRLDAIEAKLK